MAVREGHDKCKKTIKKREIEKETDFREIIKVKLKSKKENYCKEDWKKQWRRKNKKERKNGNMKIKSD